MPTKNVACVSMFACTCTCMCFFFKQSDSMAVAVFLGSPGQRGCMSPHSYSTHDVLLGHHGQGHPVPS